jgi:hypothetical protein
MMIFPFLEEAFTQDLPVGPATVSSVVEIHQTNREKVIAETYWQFVFDEEKQKKM